MATLTVRGLDPEVIEGLKALSSSHGRSMEAEVRLMVTRLAQGVEGPVDDPVAAAAPAAAGTAPTPENWVHDFRRRLAERDSFLDDEFVEGLDRERRAQAPARSVDFG
ncbi:MULTISPECIES: hypothetical protein [unclassified Frigoribacterium]|uniref:FitA-like ribbon-helix-helix domain-containing protein n=1 Tax=unclassified Frigoribacterium TaxID=2627005 RepID=UPI0006F5A368|nr:MULTISPECIES: hypothetical protein [unclassified Frigoribacterium]KQO47594.1 hypothetical protein ASF07_08970 [Frigoribacterium sp. Leaf254]KQT39687.1 hypothetical protein ASG28_08975 [Frigoribacterium sp. Leaf415]